MPNTFSCLIENDRASFSALEKPAPSCRLPVGFSTTLMFRSTWSGAPGHVAGLDVDVLEVAQAVDPVARELDLVGVVPGRFELAELAAHHFVARAVVARDVDAPHVGAAGRLGREHEGHPVVGAVDLRAGLDVGEGIAEVAEVVGERLGGLGHLVGVVGLARADGHQRLELVLLAEVVAFQPDAGNHIPLALRHVDGDGDVLLVGRDRHLGGIDAEFQVAAAQVVRAQRLQVGIELGARVAVGLGVPAQPAAGVEVEQALERRLAERIVADDPDFVDAGRLALGHRERQVDAVALDGRHGGHDLGAVQAPVDVLALEFLLGAVGQGLVIRTAFGQADLAQRLLQRVLVEFLGAHEIDVGHRRTLFDDHDQHVARSPRAARP